MCVCVCVCVCVPLNYLTCEKNGAIEIHHNKNNNIGMKPASSCPFKDISVSEGGSCIRQSTAAPVHSRCVAKSLRMTNHQIVLFACSVSNEALVCDARVQT